MVSQNRQDVTMSWPFSALAKLCAFMHHGTLRVHTNFVEKSVFRGEGGRETHETRSRLSTIHQPTLQVDWRGLRESQVPPRFRNRNFHKNSTQIWSRRPTVLLQILLQNRKSNIWDRRTSANVGEHRRTNPSKKIITICSFVGPKGC